MHMAAEEEEAEERRKSKRESIKGRETENPCRGMRIRCRLFSFFLFFLNLLKRAVKDLKKKNGCNMGNWD